MVGLLRNDKKRSVNGEMKWKDFVDAILGTASTTAMIVLILLGASTFNAFLGFA